MPDDALTRHFFTGFIRLHILYHAAKDPVYGAEILRDSPERRLPPATRKALMLRIARAGAARLLAAELAGVAVPALDDEGE